MPIITFLLGIGVVVWLAKTPLLKPSPKPLTEQEYLQLGSRKKWLAMCFR